MTLRDTLRQLAARPSGVRSTDSALGAWDGRQLHNELGKLVKRGELHRAKISHKHTVFFADKARAEAYQAKHAKVPETHKSVQPAQALRAGWAPSDPARVPPGVKVTVCPPYRPRFVAIDVPGVFGGLQRGRVSV